jgi:nucleotide-binding universal stress UspA family protein
MGIEDDRLVEEQEAEAAREAAEVGGGHVADDGIDDSQRPVLEAGGGESEGFEQAEAELIRHASHADDRSDTVTFTEAGRPEAESDRQTGEFGEADRIDGQGRSERD